MVDPASWPLEDDGKEEIVSMAATRVVMHQIVLPAEVDSLGICFGGQVSMRVPTHMQQRNLLCAKTCQVVVPLPVWVEGEGFWIQLASLKGTRVHSRRPGKLGSESLCCRC